MKLSIALIAVLALAAAPAMAQGTFNNGRKPSTFGGAPSSPPKPAGAYVPSYTSPAAAKPRNPADATTTTPPAFKPYGGYEPYKPTSMFGPDGKPRR